MRYRILASFQGAPYEAGVGPTESDVVLFAACPPPEALKFEPATGHWRKRVSRGEVQSLYESRPVGMFRGERCIVLDDLSDRLHIVYLGHDAIRAAQLGYWEVDRGVFELITPRHEVTDIVEQRLPLTIRGESGQHTKPGLTPSERSDDFGAASRNGLPYGGGDSHLYGYGGHDEFATGPQFFDQSARLGGLPPSISQDLPIAGLSRSELSRSELSRSEPSQARPADQSNVAIPPVPEPPLPLEAEAMRAASSAVRRGQKSSQPRQAQDARPARRPQPPVAAQVPAAPVPPPAPVAPAQVAATRVAAPPIAPAPVGPAQVPAKPAEATTAATEATIATPQAAEVNLPSAAPVPAAATLTKAAMLSHAAATAARLAAATSAPPSAPSSEQPDLAASPAAESGEPSQATEQHAGVVTEAGLITTGVVPAEPASVAAEPAQLPAESTELPAESAQVAPERVGVPISQPTNVQVASSEPTATADQVAASEPATASQPVAASQPATASQPTTGSEPVTVSEPVAASEPADAQAHGPAGPGQDGMQDLPPAASAVLSAPIAPASVAPRVPVPAPAAPSPSGPDRPTSPELSAPSPGTAEQAPALSADATPIAPPQISPDYSDGTAGATLAGISDPPSVANPPTPAVPSWMPQGPAQPQQGVDVPSPVQPVQDVAASHDGYYAPYAVSEPMPRNGTGTANGAAAPFDFGLIAPMPVQQPGFTPPSLFPAEPGLLPPTHETSEPAGQAQADPGAMTRRRSTKRRLPTQKIFSDLATQAAIPAAAYAIGEEVDGSMCLMRTDEGFEVFNAAAGARHEVRVFQDEESAYFYLFGVLVAESVRTGALVPRD